MITVEDITATDLVQYVRLCKEESGVTTVAELCDELEGRYGWPVMDRYRSIDPSCLALNNLIFIHTEDTEIFKKRGMTKPCYHLALRLKAPIL